MVDFISQLEPGYLYPALFFGLIFLGGVVLLPSLYLTMIGSLGLAPLFAVAVAASIASDSFWYFIGTTTKKEKIYSWKFVQKRMEEAKAFSSFYQKHGVILVFFTKFIYGTRVASHVLAGVHKISYPKFVLATTSGCVIWFWVFYYLVRWLDMGLSSVETTALRIQLFVLILTVIVIGFNWLSGKYLKRKLLR